MDNKNKKIILDLCGGTGSWSKPYRDAGYTVKVITLPQYDVTDVEFDGNWMHFRRQDVRWNDHMLVDCKDVYGILAAPPCTEFSLAKTTRQRELNIGMQTVEACLRIIWECRLQQKIKFWAMENPCGLLRQFLGRPPFTFCQWEFGGAFYKKTDLWGFFNIPKKTVFVKPGNLTKRFPCGSYNSKTWSYPVCP